MKKLLPVKGFLLGVLSLVSYYSYSQTQSNTCTTLGTATALTTGVCVTGTVVGSTADAITTCSGTVRYDVWYKFVATSTNPTITLSSIGANLHNSPSFTNDVRARLQLFTAGCAAGNSITCGGTSLTGSRLTVGSTYYVRVYSTTSNAIPTTNAGFTICVNDPVPLQSSRMNEVFQQTTLSGTNLIDNPWEIIYGPDNFLWITEASGYRVYRMNPVTGERTTILELFPGATGYLTAQEHTDYNRASSGFGQGGLAGMVLHPDWATKKWVYLSYIYIHNSTAANSFGVFYTNRIVRFTYNPGTNKLENPVMVCNTLPGSSDHNSQRMIIAPVSGTNYLFYAAGDMGAGQFGNAQRPIHAQTINVYEGKILRFNLEPDLTAPVNDQWIPGDNPFNANPVSPSARNAVWSLGIRNNQGFAYMGGKLFGSSHGPYSDDEINVIAKEKNYGHPRVIGYAFDNNYNGSRAGHRNGNDATNHPTSMPAITNEAADSVAIPNYKTPMFSAYPSTQANINDIWTRENDGIAGNGTGNGSWPSEGWSGMDAYTHTQIPGWKNSLLLGSLKWGRVLRFKVDAVTETVRPIDGYDTLSYFGSTNRFRDMAVAPNGKDLFVVMDKSETTSGPSAANPRVSACNGCVQKYTFLGYNNNTVTNRSTIPATIDVAAGNAGICTAGGIVVINSANNNTNIWVPITGPDGNIVAEIKANGNNLDTVRTSFYVNSGNVRQDGTGRLYLDRNLTINPKVAPASAVDVRLYITKAELDALRTATNSAGAPSGVTGVGNLAVYKNSDVCGSPFTSATTRLTPTYAEAHGTNGNVLNVSITSFSTFYFANSSFTLLPMELIVFKGNLKNKAALLRWDTKNENKTAKFIVERSIDATNFEQIGTVLATGSTGQPAAYSYTDKEVLNLASALVYYRLQIRDEDGTVTYSKVISITLAGSTTFTVYPNPVTDVLKVKLSAAKKDEVEIQVTDMQGRIIHRQNRSLESGNNEININAKSWPAQTYSVKVISVGNKILMSQNVIKL